MLLIIERINNGFAVLEKDDLTHIDVDIGLLPSGIKEGSVLDFDGFEYRLNVDAEAEIRKRIKEKQKSVFKKK